MLHWNRNKGLGALAVALALIGGLFLSAMGGEGQLANFQTWVAANPEHRLLVIGDSWVHGDSYTGATASANYPVSRPYSWATVSADPTASNGNLLTNHLAWRVGTHKQAALAIGSMELMLGTTADATRAQQDSSVFGLMRSGNVETYRPDVVLFPTGSWFNDLIAGSDTYAELKAETIAAARRSIEVFGNEADWIVWVAPRPVGLYAYTMQSSGTADAKRAIAITRSDLIEKIGTFVSDTLRTTLSAAGLRTQNFLTFDSGPYATLADTTGLYALFECGDAGDYAAVRHLRWSPRSWYQSDNIHLNALGNKSLADSLALHLFGVELDNSYTPGAGVKIYCDLANGNNWLNRMECTNPNTPLATVQAAVDQAHPGDVVAVIGTGNQCVMAYDTTSARLVSAKEFELVVNKPGITIELAPGAYFEGVYEVDADIAGGIQSGDLPNVGQSFMDYTACTAGTAADSLSHDIQGTFTGANPQVELDLTLRGGQIKGYLYPLRWYNYSGITLEDMTLIGGAGDGLTLYPENYGQLMELNLDGVTVYADSSTANATTYGQVRLSMQVAVTDADRYTGTWRDCQFIGKASLSGQALTYGAFTGLEFIQCTWEDPACSATAGVDFGTYTYTSYPPTLFLGCRFELNRVNTSLYAIKMPSALLDTLFLINTDFNLLGATTSAFAVEFSAGPDAAGVGYMAGCAFVKSNYPAATRTDQTPSTGTAPDVSTHNFLVTLTNTLDAEDDTTRFGGVRSWAGYTLEDFGIEHGPYHASIGPVQSTAPPTVSLTSSALGNPGIPDYAEFSLGGLAYLYTSGVLLPTDSLDVKTYGRVQAPNTPAEQAAFDLLLDQYRDLPNATRVAMKLTTVY